MKKLLKLISTLLTIVLVFQTIQIGVVAAQRVTRIIDSGARTQKTDNLNHTIEIEDYESPILGEVESLRNESTKHFRKADGTFVATSYREPVHVQDEEGNWIDIDAALSLKETDGEAFFVAQALPNPVCFPQSFADRQQASIEANGHKISFGVSDLNDTPTTIKPEPEMTIDEPREGKNEAKEVQQTVELPTRTEPSTTDVTEETPDSTTEAEAPSESTTGAEENQEPTTESLDPMEGNNEIDDTQGAIEAPMNYMMYPVQLATQKTASCTSLTRMDEAHPTALAERFLKVHGTIKYPNAALIPLTPLTVQGWKFYTRQMTERMNSIKK